MKQLFTLSLLFLSSFVFAQDYYWVGNSGDWTDPSHWATTSGGSEFHTEAPGQDNDVYFDANSFTLPNQDVVINEANVYCRNFSTEGVTNSPTFTAPQSNNALRVYGNFVVTEGALRDFGWIVMSSETDGSTVSTGNLSLGVNSYLLFGSEGYQDYYLTDSVSCKSFGVSRGALYTNNFPIHCTSGFNSNYGPDRAIYLGTSSVYCNHLTVNSNMEMDADEASFYIDQGGVWENFQGGGFEYGYVEMTGNINVLYGNTFGELVVNPGSEITLEEGTTQTAGQFSFVGTSDDPITIVSSSAGNQASFSQASGTVDADWLVLRDNVATGGAVFTADHSINLGNNMGWNIIENLPANYYWVNGSGDWSDLSHWATTSGGSEYHEALPSPQDTVIVDANSFVDAGTLTIDEEASIAEFRMDNVFAGVTIDAEEDLHLFGDFTASAGVVGDFKGVYFDGAPGPYYITSNGMYWGAQSELTFVAGGVYYFNDDVAAQAINVDGGAAIAENITLDMDWQIRVQSVSNPFLDVSGSVVNCNFWRAYDLDANSYDLEGALFNCNNQFYGAGLEYDVVNISGNATVTYGAHFGILNIAPGTELTLESAATFEVDEMIALGTMEDVITIRATEEGDEAFFEGNLFDVNADYLDLQDNHAIGTVNFVADHSVFGSNVEGWQDATGVEELEQSVLVYPLPFQNELIIDGLTGQEHIRVYNQLGALVHDQLNTDAGIARVHLNHLLSGVYQLVIEGDTLRSKTIIKN